MEKQSLEGEVYMSDFTSESQESLEEIMDEEYKLKELIIGLLNRRHMQDKMMEEKEEDESRS